MFLAMMLGLQYSVLLLNPTSPPLSLRGLRRNASTIAPTNELCLYMKFEHIKDVQQVTSTWIHCRGGQNGRDITVDICSRCWQRPFSKAGSGILTCIGS